MVAAVKCSRHIMDSHPSIDQQGFQLLLGKQSIGGIGFKWGYFVFAKYGANGRLLDHVLGSELFYG
jgi:hypothetical protein